MNRSRKQITVDADIGAALRRLAIGELRDYQEQPNGDMTFEVDDEVAAEIERLRQPGESDSSVLRRIIAERTDISLRPKKPN
jgi:hypothetical protein